MEGMYHPNVGQISFPSFPPLLDGKNTGARLNLYIFSAMIFNSASVPSGLWCERALHLYVYAVAFSFLFFFFLNEAAFFPLRLSFTGAVNRAANGIEESRVNANPIKDVNGGSRRNEKKPKINNPSKPLATMQHCATKIYIHLRKDLR